MSLNEKYDSDAAIRCPNVTTGWARGIESLLLDSKDRVKKILDVGCGNVGLLLKEGPNVWGIDPNLGTMRFNGDGKDYGKIAVAVPERAIKGYAEDLPFSDEEFDIAVSTKAVGWYPRQIKTRLALAEMLRVIKKKSGYVTFNIGQEMTADIINPVLLGLQSEGIRVQVVNDCWCVLQHPEFQQDNK